MANLPYSLDIIAHNTIAVLTVLPTKKAQWVETIQQGRAQAQAARESPLVALLDAITRLLEGDKPGPTPPGLDGAYASCWQNIVEGIANSPKRDPVTYAVLALLNCDTWDESKRIVKTMEDVLLTEAADQVLENLLEQYNDDQEMMAEIEAHRELLRRCQIDGIDKAFALFVQQAQQAQLGIDGDDLDELHRILAELVDPPRSVHELPHRVTLCRRALELIGPSQQPMLWAFVQHTLGDSLFQNPMGEHSENQEQAIKAYYAALQVRTFKESPVEWAMTQNNLGAVYAERIAGNQSDNLERAIEAFGDALQVDRRQNFPTVRPPRGAGRPER